MAIEEGEVRDQSNSQPQSAWSSMVTDAQSHKARDGDIADDNVETTPAANIYAVNANTNTAPFKDIKKMFPTFGNK